MLKRHYSHTHISNSLILLNLISIPFISSSTLFAMEENLGLEKDFSTCTDVFISEVKMSDLQADTDIFINCLRQIPISHFSSISDIFILYDRNNEAYRERAEVFCSYLVEARINPSSLYFDLRPGSASDVHQHADKILTSQKVIVLGSPSLKKEYSKNVGILSQEVGLLRTRMLKKGNEGIILSFSEGDFTENYPDNFSLFPIRNLRADYHLSFFELLMDILPGISLHHPIKIIKEEFSKLRKIPSSMLNDYNLKLLKFQKEQNDRGNNTRMRILTEAQRERDAGLSRTDSLFTALDDARVFQEGTVHNIPKFSRLSLFVESKPKDSEESYLAKIHRNLSEHSSITNSVTACTIEGMGGVGKTYLA
jgi:hypothetical protein